MQARRKHKVSMCKCTHRTFITHAQWGAWVIFWYDICACKFMPAYIYHAIFRVGRGGGGGRGLFEMFSGGCKFFFVVLAKCVERFKKGNIVLKCIWPWSINLFCMTKISCVLPAINHPSHVSSPTRREGCPLTIAYCYMSRWFFQPLRGCECFSQNLHLFVEVFFDIVKPEVSF